MSEKALITVIIPVYNTLEYLPRCVQSVMAQTYENLEILLVDDGSTDGSSELCDGFAAKDPRVRVLHKENGGSSSARNLGLSECRGDYVGFVDSDDHVDPDMYETLFLGLQGSDASIAQVGRDEIDAQGNLMENICDPPNEREMISAEDFFRELLMHRGDCSFCTKLLRRELLRTERFPEGKLNEDFYLLIRILCGSEGIVSLPGRKYHVFYRLGSNSRKKDPNDFSRVYADCVENADLAATLVSEHFPKLSETAFRFGVFQRLEYLLHVPIPQMKRENETYVAIVRFLRRNWTGVMKNKILTKKNKAYATAFAIMPRGIRVLHKGWMKVRK